MPTEWQKNTFCPLHKIQTEKSYLIALSDVNFAADFATRFAIDFMQAHTLYISY